jgi:hypothetical protein
MAYWERFVVGSHDALVDQDKVLLGECIESTVHSELSAHRRAFLASRHGFNRERTEARRLLPSYPTPENRHAACYMKKWDSEEDNSTLFIM